MSCPGTMRKIMENRLLMKIDQEEAMLEVLEELRQLDFIGNCWFDGVWPHRISDDVIR